MDVSEAPSIVIWEVTQACALSCLHCRAEAKPQRDSLELSTREGMDLIDQVASLHAPLMILTGGDPMERDDLLELVQYGISKGLQMALSPSATPKVTVQRLQELRSAGLHRVALSIDGSDARTHDAFRGSPGSFARTFEIAEWLREMKLPLQIGTTITRHNAHQLESIGELVGSLGIVLWSVFFLVPTGRASMESMISASESEYLLEKLYTIARRSKFVVKTTEAPQYRRIVAQKGGRVRPARYAINDAKGFVFVSHRGDVFPSGFLPLNAGNIRKTQLGKIYREDRVFQLLRDPDALKGKCRRCEYRLLCGGSRARAYAVLGDPLQSDPMCAYRPPVV